MATKNFVPRADGEGTLGKASKRWGKIIGNDIDVPFLNARISGAAYAVGDKVNAPYYTDYYLLCQTAGTTSTTTITKAQMTAAIIAGTLTDGTVTWGVHYNQYNNIGVNKTSIDIREITSTLYASGKFSSQIQDDSFRDVCIGQCFTVPTTIDGTSYNLKYVNLHLNPFRGTDNTGYAIFNQPHVALGIFGLPRHVMNSTDTAAGGYFGSEMRTWLQNSVLPGVEAALGASHLIQHKKLLSTAVDTTRVNRYGQASGAVSNWEWKDSKLDLMSEAQIYGTISWSSSGFDIGEAFQQFELFKHVRPQFFQNETFWTRDVASASGFAYSSYTGIANDYGASDTYIAPLPLILYH